MEHSDRLEERINNRRARRWKRRGRIVAPLLAIPLLLATLLLSVDLIEYKPVKPEDEPAKATERVREAPIVTPAPHHATRAAMATSAIPNLELLSVRPAEGSLQRAIEATPVLPDANELRPPTPPAPLEIR